MGGGFRGAATGARMPRWAFDWADLSVLYGVLPEATHFYAKKLALGHLIPGATGGKAPAGSQTSVHSHPQRDLFQAVGCVPCLLSCGMARAWPVIDTVHCPASAKIGAQLAVGLAHLSHGL